MTIYIQKDGRGVPHRILEKAPRFKPKGTLLGHGLDGEEHRTDYDTAWGDNHATYQFRRGRCGWVRVATPKDEARLDEIRAEIEEVRATLSRLVKKRNTVASLAFGRGRPVVRDDCTELAR